MANIFNFAIGKKNEAVAEGAWFFLNVNDGAMFRRDDDSNPAGKLKRPRKAVVRAARKPSRVTRTRVKTRAMADVGTEDGARARNVLHQARFPFAEGARLNRHPLMPISRLGAPGAGYARTSRFLSSTEPEPYCSAGGDFVMSAFVLMFACMVLIKFPGMRKQPGFDEPLMDA